MFDGDNKILKSASCQQGLRPRPRVPDIFENGDFSLRFILPSTRKRRLLAPKTEVFENYPLSGV